MLDYRLKTFLVLCKTLNYTKTAQLLHMSQPAVSQHIHFIEQTYEIKLFDYEKKKLKLTITGEKLHQEVLTLQANAINIFDHIKDSENETYLRFDCTFTFGEYIMPSILIDWMREDPKLHLNMQIKNTTECLEDLDRGEIEFALIEGFFNKAMYPHTLIQNTQMILVVPRNHPLSTKQEVLLSDVIQYPLIIRKKESRVRGILPSGLAAHNFSYDSFTSFIEVGSMNIMKKMIMKNIGIGFLHDATVKDDIKKGHLVHVKIEDFTLHREMNMVYLDNVQKKEKIDQVSTDILKFLANNDK